MIVTENERFDFLKLAKICICIIQSIHKYVWIKTELISDKKK